MKAGRAGRGLAAIVLCVLALSGCTDDSAVDGDPVDPTPTATSGAGTAAEAARLRHRLEGQFALFGFAALEATRSAKADQDTADALVDDATSGLLSTVESAYDEETAGRLEGELRAWSSELARFADGKKQAREQAQTRLDAVADDIGEFMADTTGGEMEADGTAALVRRPLRSSTDAIEAFDDRDFEAAYTDTRSVYAELVSVGQAFAAGISQDQPERYAGARSSGPVELHSALQQFLGEHALLTGSVTRRGARGTRDFSAAAAALNGNTEDIATALGAYYGDATARMTAAWRDRISLLADYTVAAAEERVRRKDDLRKDLRRADERLGQTLDRLTEGNVEATAATSTMDELTTAVVRHVDGQVDGDSRAASTAQLQAYDAASEVADLIAEGIVAHRPDDFESS